MAEKIPIRWLIVFCTIMLVVGVLLTIMTFNDLEMAKESEEWPSTTGMVVSTYIGTEYDSEDERDYFYPHVVYEFRIDGVNYTSDYLTVGGHSSRYNSKASARDFLDDYPVGSEVVVYYNPDNPEMCALETGPQGHHYWYIAGSIFMVVLFGFTLGVFAWGELVGWGEEEKPKPADESYKSYGLDLSGLGEKLADLDAIIVDKGRSLDPKICPDCSAELLSGDEFCASCGGKIEISEI